jgi:putative peptide zinc metalloprotease protein
MHHSLAPRLRADVAVRPFDAAEGDCRFVVAVDDRHFVVTAAVAAVLEESRKPGTFESLARRVSARLGICVSPEQVGQLLREQAPAILFRVGQSRPLRGPLWFRRRIASGAALEPALKWSARLFTTRVAIALTAVFVLVDLLVASRVVGTPGQALATADIGAAFALTAAGIAVHELGHLAACSRFGGRHGGVGLGLYWCFPTLYAEVHGAWMLPRLQRAAVDIAGVYFQCVYVFALGLCYLATDAAAVLSAIAWSHLMMLHTLNPVLKFDGYWLLADLTGSYNLHQRIRSIAGRAWQALARTQAHRMPQRREMALLIGFVTIALVYFTYVLVMLAHNIAAAALGVLHPVSALQALANGTLLALCIVMSGGVALLLARSVTLFAREDSDDR